MLTVAALTLTAGTAPRAPQELSPAAVDPRVPQLEVPQAVSQSAAPQEAHVLAPQAAPQPMDPQAALQPVAPQVAPEPMAPLTAQQLPVPVPVAAEPSDSVAIALKTSTLDRAAKHVESCDEATLKQIKATDDPRALGACIDAASTGVGAALVLNYATQIENAMRKGPRAEANRRRRVLLNRALYWKGDHSPLQSADEAAFDEALGGLLSAFKETFLAKHTGKEKLLFSHISKAGGTSFHDLAVANKKLMPSDVDSDGGWMRGDGPVWCCDQPVELTCAERISKIGSNELVFQERFLDSNGGVGRPQLCEEIVYGVMFRKPIDRIISHINELTHYLHFEAAQPDKRLVGRLVDVIEGGCPDDGAAANALYLDDAVAQLNATQRDETQGWKKKASAREFGQNICGVLSNYMTRSMLGSAVFGKDAFKTHFNDTLAEDSLDAAIAVVQSFSLVLLLEESAKDQSQLDYFNMTMGFSTADLASHHMRSTSPADATRDEYHHGLLLVKENLDVNEQAMLQKHNQADLELYDVAQMVFAQDLFFHAYVAGKPVAVPTWKSSGSSKPDST